MGIRDIHRLSELLEGSATTTLTYDGNGVPSTLEVIRENEVVQVAVTPREAGE